MSIERKESQFLAENVKRHRLKHAWTQEQLAEICSVNVRTVQRVEKQGQASLETKKALAGAFNLTVEKLTTAESFEQPKSQTTNQINEPYWKSRVRAFSKNAFTLALAFSGVFLMNYIFYPEKTWNYHWSAIWAVVIVVIEIRAFSLRWFSGRT
ncbi:helix-turn-helix domain-containing protein [Vibrio marisflavi]|uniref:HTH cro/C1-type domain-containing protein n=1 Tax=Vibrio marisflavi CECT 7928 TaxID=634439 RepID=A0ABM9A5J8_9VIBR|nr:helix-turn-helix transcriptional regulator [Vibrio marisflavi]CAH0540139.1 hypothetical protein VMF7928_02637 [Vibrio marisflavi CECT 7928]